MSVNKEYSNISDNSVLISELNVKNDCSYEEKEI